MLGTAMADPGGRKGGKCSPILSTSRMENILENEYFLTFQLRKKCYLWEKKLLLILSSSVSIILIINSSILKIFDQITTESSGVGCPNLALLFSQFYKIRTDYKKIPKRVSLYYMNACPQFLVVKGFHYRKFVINWNNAKLETSPFFYTFIKAIVK